VLTFPYSFACQQEESPMPDNRLTMAFTRQNFTHFDVRLLNDDECRLLCEDVMDTARAEECSYDEAERRIYTRVQPATLRSYVDTLMAQWRRDLA
jgi:hypothetical protein